MKFAGARILAPRTRLVHSRLCSDAPHEEVEGGDEGRGRGEQRPGARAGGEHEDGDAHVGRPEPLDDLDRVEVGQHPIEHQQVEGLDERPGEGFI